MALTMEKPAWWPGSKDASRADDPGPDARGTGGAFRPSAPRVNLVPASALRKAATRFDTKIAVAIVLASVIGAGGWWFAGLTAKQNAQQALDDATDRGTTLTKELAYYAPVTLIEQQTQSLKGTVAAQTETEVLHQDVAKTFLATISSQLTLTNMEVTADGPGACVQVDPFETVDLAGCITFSGNAVGADAASQIVAALNANPWFAYAFIPTVTSGDTGGGTVEITGSVGLTDQALAANAAQPSPDTAAGEAAPADATQDDALDQAAQNQATDDAVKQASEGEN